MSLLFTYIAILILSGLIVFQLLLVAGAPLGKYAWGGKSRHLTPKLRVASVFSICLYLLFVAFIATKAQFVSIVANDQILNAGMWIFTIYFFIGIAMNAVSRSKSERNVMTPVAAMLAVSFLAVAIS